MAQLKRRVIAVAVYLTICFPLSLDEMDSDGIDQQIWRLIPDWDKQEKILMVDDDLQIQDMAKKMLTELNYDAIAIGSGEMAIQYIESNSVDLILLKMIMP